MLARSWARFGLTKEGNQDGYVRVIRDVVQNVRIDWSEDSRTEHMGFGTQAQEAFAGDGLNGDGNPRGMVSQEAPCRSWISTSLRQRSGRRIRTSRSTPVQFREGGAGQFIIQFILDKKGCMATKCEAKTSPNSK
jgi:hypothetical protein